MNFTILMYESEADFACRTNPEKSAAYVARWIAYTKAVKEAGIWVAGAGLQPGHAGTTVKLKAGKRQVQDGPYADTKEQLGGFCIIDVPSLDAALDWAARCPAAANGAVEVRPTLPPV